MSSAPRSSEVEEVGGVVMSKSGLFQKGNFLCPSLLPSFLAHPLIEIGAHAAQAGLELLVRMTLNF